MHWYSQYYIYSTTAHAHLHDLVKIKVTHTPFLSKHFNDNIYHRKCVITVALDYAFSCQNRWSDQLDNETLQNIPLCTNVLGSQDTSKSTLLFFF